MNRISDAVDDLRSQAYLLLSDYGIKVDTGKDAEKILKELPAADVVEDLVKLKLDDSSDYEPPTPTVTPKKRKSVASTSSSATKKRKTNDEPTAEDGAGGGGDAATTSSPKRSRRIGRSAKK